MNKQQTRKKRKEVFRQALPITLPSLRLVLAKRQHFITLFTIMASILKWKSSSVPQTMRTKWFRNLVAALKITRTNVWRTLPKEAIDFACQEPLLASHRHKMQTKYCKKYPLKRWSMYIEAAIFAQCPVAWFVLTINLLVPNWRRRIEIWTPRDFGWVNINNNFNEVIIWWTL